MQQQLGNMHDLTSTMNNNHDWQQPSILTSGDMMNVASNEGVNSSSLTQQQQLAAAAFMLGGSGNNNSGTGNTIGIGSANDPSAIEHHLNLLQQQIQQRQQQLQLAQQLQQQQFQAQATISNVGIMSSEPTTQRRRVEVEDQQIKVEIPQTILAHTHMLDRGDPDGSRLRAYYRLSIDEMFRLPCTPSDDEYCANTGQPLVGRHLAALSAARFAETALGAIVNNEVTLAMELCNAVVHCLREAVQDQIDSSIVFEVAKAYFLLGVFRSIRGDMVRYFKYRRVALSYVAKLKVSEYIFLFIFLRRLLS
jgi:hypothetical protein